MDQTDLEKKLNEINVFGGNLDQNDHSTITEYIHTGNYILNACISGSAQKGIPNNRSICIAGEEGTGKTFLALNMCREAQRLGYKPIYFDTEGAVDREMAVKFGIDPQNLSYQPVSDIHTFKQMITTIIKEGRNAKKEGKEVPKTMIVLDSLGMLASTKEIDDALEGNDKRDMTKPQLIRQIFRLITSDLAGLKIPFIFTNHVYDSNDMFGGKNISGGGGLKYAASTILTLTKAKIKDDKKDSRRQTGITVTATSVKNRMARPIYIKFKIRFDTGMNPYAGLHNYIDWDTCGIERGKIISEAEMKKIKDTKKKEETEATRFVASDEKGKEKNFYFYRNPNAQRFAVRHLNKNVQPADIFSPEVFTNEVIEKMDESIIRPEFEYGDGGEDDLGSIFESGEEETQNNE